MSEGLLIKYLLKETSGEENQLVEQWLTEKPENQKQFEQIQDVWESSKMLAVTSETNEALVWERFKAKRALREQKVKSLRKTYNFLKIAAVLFLVSVAVWFYVTQLLVEKDFTAQNEVRTETLSDGSVLTLNKNSKFSFTSAKNQRLVKLEKGEIFFDVAHDETKPFIISITGDITIRVVGTSFNVRHKDRKTEIIVETGLVKVSRGNNEAYLQPGEKLELDADSGTFHKQENTSQLYKYYRNNEFDIDNVPLEKVVEVLNEAYNLKISIRQEELKKATLNAKFKNESPDRILKVIAETFDIKVIRKDSEIILTRTNE